MGTLAGHQQHRVRQVAPNLVHGVEKRRNAFGRVLSSNEADHRPISEPVPFSDERTINSIEPRRIDAGTRDGDCIGSTVFYELALRVRTNDGRVAITQHSTVANVSRPFLLDV